MLAFSFHIHDSLLDALTTSFERPASLRRQPILPLNNSPQRYVPAASAGPIDRRPSLGFRVTSSARHVKDARPNASNSSANRYLASAASARTLGS